MENEDIVRELAEQGERIKVANKRIADLEEQQLCSPLGCLQEWQRCSIHHRAYIYC